VLIDYICEREVFIQASTEIFRLCETKQIQASIAAHSVQNILYILRKDYTQAQLREILLYICNALNVIEIDRYKVILALQNKRFRDFEDCLQSLCAEKFYAKYIITRNCKDFSASVVPAVSPQEFLALFN